MKITREEGSPREAVLNIELAPEDVDPYLDRAYRRVVSRVQIPGFRKGKAPRSILENFMGRDALLREALDFMVPESIEQATKSEGLDAFAQPDVELLELDPVSIKAVVPLAPEVDLGDYRSIRKRQEPVLVSEKQVDQVVEHLRDRSTPWEPAERPIRFGDLVTLDLEGTVEGKQVAKDEAVDFVPRQDNPSPLPGFSVHLEGMAQGEEKEFTLPIPQDDKDASLAGKECRFRVKVLEVKEKRLPELDDDFAKSVGEGYESLEDMRSKLRERLTAEAENSSRQSFQEALVEEVVTGAQVEMSPLLVEREVEHLLHEQERALKDRRMDMDAYLQQVGKSQDEIKDELRTQAQERLVRVLVLRELAAKEDIEVEPQEVDAEVEQMSSSSGDSGEALRRAFSSPNGRSSLSSAILRRKVLERLEEIVTQGDSSKEPSSGEDSPQESDEGGDAHDA